MLLGNTTKPTARGKGHLLQSDCVCAEIGDCSDSTETHDRLQVVSCHSLRDVFREEELVNDLQGTGMQTNMASEAGCVRCHSCVTSPC